MYEPIRTMMRREPTATVLPDSPLSTGAYTCQAAVDASGQYVYLAEGAGVFGFAIYNSGALATVPPENLSVETVFETSDIQEE